jgi:hypothetical protein
VVHLVRVPASSVLKPRDAQLQEGCGRPRPVVGYPLESGHSFVAPHRAARNLIVCLRHYAPFAKDMLPTEGYPTMVTTSVTYLSQ